MNQLHHARCASAEPPAIIMAQGRFGKYKKEDSHGIRQAEASGDEIQRLRQLREMLRGMTPEQAMQVMEFHKGLNVFEALTLAKREGALIVPNYVHDRILTETVDTAFLRSYPVWTGTVVIYAAPGKAFRKRFVSSWEDEGARYSVSFDIPLQFRGKKDCVLVVEHPDFDLVSLGNNTYELRIFGESTIHLSGNLPGGHGGFFRCDESYIGPLVGGLWQSVALLEDCWPSSVLRVAVIR